MNKVTFGMESGASGLSSDQIEAPAAAALVTGGARRLGAAVAERLARAGFAVAIHCNASSERAEELASRLGRQHGIRTCVIKRDLAHENVRHLIEQAGDGLGARLNLLVNSASVFEADRADAFDPEHFEMHMTVNVQAPLALSSAFAEQAPDGSAIVNLLDQRVLRSNPRYFSYTLSKSALHAATRIMAQTFAPCIRVNGVAPGLTLANARQDQADFARRVETLPLKRGGSAEEVAEVVLFLATCPSVTGQTIAVDGGQHLAWQTPDAVPTI